MFGSMEIWAASSLLSALEPSVIHSNVAEPRSIEAIVPTVVFPFVLISAILSSIITAVAGFFGIKWEAQAPRALLGKLLRPKVLVIALLLNGVIFGGVKGYERVTTSSRPLWWVQYQNRAAIASDRTYTDTWNVNPRQDASSRLVGAGGLKTAWRTQLPGSSFRGVAVSGDSLFLGGDKGVVYEIDRQDGRKIREFYVGTPVTPMPLIWNQTLFAGEGIHTTRHARIYAFDLKSGRLRGVVQTKGHTEGDMVLALHKDRPLLFIPAGADGLHAVDANTLAAVWHAPLPHFDSGVLVAGERVFAATGVEKGEEDQTSSLFALAIDTGQVLWKTDLAASGWSRPVVVGDAVCVGLGDIYLKKNYGQLACFRMQDGQPATAINVRGPIFNTPLPIVNTDSNLQSNSAQQVAEPTALLVSDLRGQACLISPTEATTRWCADLETKKNLYASLAIAGRMVLAPTERSLRILDLETGFRVADWTHDNGHAWTPAYAGISVTGDEAYLIDQKGTLVKLIPK